MIMHTLFALTYAILAYLLWWAADAHLTNFLIGYGIIAVLLMGIHITYLNDRRRERNHNDDIDWDY